MKIKRSQYGEITLSFTDVGNSYPSQELNMANMPLSAIRENKILAKISEYNIQ